MSANLPAEIPELIRIYEQHQKKLEYWRNKNKTPERLAYQRQKSKEYYERNREIVLEKRYAYIEAHKDEINRKAIERYNKKKAEKEAKQKIETPVTA